jgi:lipoyl(octanoyl) transferase
MQTFRLIRSQPASAAYNMALDKNIFGRYLIDGMPVFRVYRWQSPAFTYGVSQDPGNEINLERCVSEKIAVVKRMTGGGVLFHGDEITYSFVCAKQDIGEPAAALISYRQICAFLIRFYASLGLAASFALEADGFKAKSQPHGLCSASHEKYDLVINGKKIGGNAQKRSRQAVFQHGSIPRGIDWDFLQRYAKSLPENIFSTVTDLSRELAVVPQKDTLEERLISAFSSAFGVRFIEEREALYEAGMVG